MLRRFIAALIIVQITLPRTYVRAAGSDGGDGNFNNFKNFADSISETLSNPEDKQNLQAQLHFADHLEKDGLLSDDPQQYDVFGISNQILQIKANDGSIHSIDLNDYRSVLPQIVYTDLRIRYDEINEQLIFEGVRGMLPDKSGGEVVARHIIPNLKLKAIAQDNSILSLIDENGHIHAIDMGYVHDQVFKNPIPVVKNIWEPTYELGKITQVEAKYITRGVRPYNEREVDANSVILKTPNGTPVFTAGDLMVRYKDENGNAHLLGVFSRETLHYHLSSAAFYLITQAALIAPNENVINYVNEVAELLNANDGTASKNEENSDIVAKRFLQNLDITQLKTLRNRLEKNIKYQNSSRDTFYYDEWLQSIDQLIKNRVHNAQDRETELNAKLDSLQKKYFIPFNGNAIQKAQDELAQIQKIQQNPEEGLAANWQENVSRKEHKNPLDPNLFKKFSIMVSKVFNIKVMATMFVTGGLAYLALPFLHDKFEAFQQIATLNWMYEHYQFPVLKNQEYRVWNLLSITCLFTVILPLTQVISWVAGNSLLLLQKAVGNKNSRTANRLRDIAKTWVPLGTYQRTISFFVRNTYAFTIYPVVRALIQYGLNQKSFFTALQRGINPFSKDPTTGERYGINNPTLSGQQLTQKVALKEKLISQLDFKQKQAKSLAWILALQAVSQQENIDPATLVQVVDGDVDASELEKILRDPKLQKDWFLISQEIYNQIKLYDIDAPDLSSIDPAMVADFYKITQAAAKKIDSYSDARKNVQTLWIKAKQNSALIYHNAPFISGGLNEFHLFRSTYVNQSVSSQSFKEVLMDYPFTILVYSLLPIPDGRADLSHPENLAANPNGFLFTGKGQLYDMMDDARFHLINNVARQVLLYQTKETKEDVSYQPIENFSLQGDEREQGFLSAAYDWITETFNPLKSDLGSYYANNYFKSWTTIQSSIAMSLILQAMTLHRTPGQALLAFFISFFASDIFYGWTDGITRRGNKMEDERFKKMTDEVQEARFEISQGIKEEDLARSRELIRSGYEKLYSLYQKYNPKALRELASFAQKMPEVFAGEDRPFEISPEDSLYYGLIAQLAIAVQNKNQDAIQNISQQIKNYMTERSDLTQDDLQKLSAQGLLEFSLSNSPVFTKSNSIITWFTTFGATVAAAILTIPFSVRLTTNSYITFENLFYWIGWNTLFYTSVYLLFSKDRVQSYVNKFQDIRAKYFSKEGPTNNLVQVKNANIPICSALFQ